MGLRDFFGAASQTLLLGGRVSLTRFADLWCIYLRLRGDNKTCALVKPSLRKVNLLRAVVAGSRGRIRF